MGESFDVRVILASFEQAWQQSGRPDLDGFLPPSNHCDSPGALFALSKMDIEYCISAGDPAPIAQRYLGRSDIRLSLQQQADLVAWEYQKRWERGETPITREQLAAWFPDLADLLTTLRPRWNCPKCKKKNITLDNASANEVACPKCHTKFPVGAW